MSELPRGWVETAIRDICELINGKAFKPSDWTTEGLPIVRIQNLNNPNSTFNHYQGLVEEKFLIEDGQLLFAWSGTPGTSFGAHIWNGGRAVLNQHIFKVDLPFSLINKHFLRNAINHKLEELIGKAHGGAGLQHVTKGKFEETLISLPPLAEQKRIVAKLDALNAKSARARTELSRIETLVSRYKQAVLRSAFLGEMTSEWRTARTDLVAASDLIARTPMPPEPRGGRAATDRVIQGKAALAVNTPPRKAPSKWQWVPLRRIARQETGHTPRRSHPEWWGGDIPWIGIKDAGAHHGRVIEETIQTTNEEGLANSAARLLPAGTVCLSRTASVGYVTIMGKPMATSQDFVTWTCTEALVPKFLMYALMAEGDDIRAFGKGTTHTTIYFPEVRAMQICLAPLEEQHEIVRRIEFAFAKIDRLAKEAKRALELVGKLDEAILAKAFRGELVPQDENDEPAELLLERIRAERAAAPKAKRGRRAKG